MRRRTESWFNLPKPVGNSCYDFIKVCIEEELKLTHVCTHSNYFILLSCKFTVLEDQDLCLFSQFDPVDFQVA